MRKIIQIATSPSGSFYILCEDGTLWATAHDPAVGANLGQETGWLHIPGPPAPETKEAASTKT
jgi:hypothetical protein